MRTEVKNGNVQKTRLSSELILKYFVGNDEKLDTLIMCNPSQVNLIITDHALYEALGSIKQYDDFKLNKLVKFLEVVEVQSYGGKKPVLKDSKVEELRKKALNK